MSLDSVINVSLPTFERLKDLFKYNLPYFSQLFRCLVLYVNTGLDSWIITIVLEYWWKEVF